METREQLIEKIRVLEGGSDWEETVINLIVEACEESVVGSDFTNHACIEGNDCRDYTHGWNTAVDRTLENLKKLKSK